MGRCCVELFDLRSRKILQFTAASFCQRRIELPLPGRNTKGHPDFETRLISHFSLLSVAVVGRLLYSGSRRRSEIRRAKHYNAAARTNQINVLCLRTEPRLERDANVGTFYTEKRHQPAICAKIIQHRPFSFPSHLRCAVPRTAVC